MNSRTKTVLLLLLLLYSSYHELWPLPHGASMNWSVSDCLSRSRSLVSLIAPNVHSYAVDAIISSQVLPLPSASVRCSPKPIQYANMYFHYWLHWMNDRIIVIDDVHSTFCGLEKRSHYIPNLMFITQNQYKPPPPPKAIYWITFVLIYCNLFIRHCTHKRRQIDLLGIVANNNKNCGHASLILQSQYHGCYEAKRSQVELCVHIAEGIWGKLLFDSFAATFSPLNCDKKATRHDFILIPIFLSYLQNYSAREEKRSLAQILLATFELFLEDAESTCILAKGNLWRRILIIIGTSRFQSEHLP